ncbi:hypothetical protein ACKLNO_03675 [Neisseriaceae bacterium B1]
MKTYTVFLPRDGEEAEPIGEICYDAMINCAKLTLHNQAPRQFYSPFAAMSAVKQTYPSAFYES